MSKVVDLSKYRHEKYLKTLYPNLDVGTSVPRFEIWYPPKIKRRHLRLVK